MDIKKILFICKHNRFRSKVAEALFNKLNKNKKITAFSRGVKLDKDRMYVAPNVKRALRKFGIKKVDNIPRDMTKKDLKKADLIVITADNVRINKKLAGKKKIIYWKISDTSQSNYPKILARVRIIRVRVKKLIDSLKI